MEEQYLRTYDICTEAGWKDMYFLLLDFKEVHGVECVTGLMFEKDTLKMHCTFELRLDRAEFTVIDYLYIDPQKFKLALLPLDK